MTMELRQTIIEELGNNQLKAGEQRRLNHTDCPAGEDTRYRLYIKRPEDKHNLVLGYCHNCGNGTSVYMGASRYSTDRRTSAGEAEDDVPCTVPKDAEFDPDIWPTSALAWLYQYELDHGDIRAMRLAYVPSFHRVLIPFYGESDDNYEPGDAINGYQLRRIQSDSVLPKYITYRDRHTGDKKVLSKSKDKHQDEIIVICEDVLSAYKIYKTGTARSLPLRGTHWTREQRFELYKEFPNARYLIWLDNDSKIVNEAAESYRNYLEFLGADDVHIVDVHHTDPKVYNEKMIRRIIDEHIKY